MRKGDAVLENLDKPIEVLVQECRGHFDPKIATDVCRDRLFPQYDQVTSRETLAEFLMLFRHESSRQEFLAFYLEELKQSVAGKANCGCVYHAEDGIPCEHDLALLGPPV